MFKCFTGRLNDTLVDSDFEITKPSHMYYVYSVIEIYEQKKLNVAANLALAIRWIVNANIYWSIEGVIEVARKNVPKYAKYADDVDKYLMLI